MSSKVSKPPIVPPAAEHTGAEDAALDQLLRQIITGFFVLTDGQGALSKWSDPAELLFGLDGDHALGEPFFGKLVQGALPAEGAGWARFLESGEAPGVRARAKLSAYNEKVGRFPIEAVFIPVKLDEGFDFSLFLEDLSFELPMDLMIMRMRQQHPVVIRALRAALSDTVQPWEGWRTAGTLVAFRPLEETPWLEDALRAREEAQAAAEEERQSRIQIYEAPEVKGSDIYDLDDARAVIDRLKWATERIEELESRARTMDSVARDAADASVRAEAAARAAQDAKSELLSGVLNAPDMGKAAEAEAERLELVARIERVERTASENAKAAAAHRLAAEEERRGLAAEERARAELTARLEAAEAARAQLTARLEAAEGARAQLAARLEALEARRAESEAGAKFDPAQLAELRAEIEALREQADAADAIADLRSELELVRDEAHGAAVRVRDAGDLRSEVDWLKVQAEDAAALRERLDVLIRHDVEATKEAEAARAELRAALERVEKLSAEAAHLRADVESARKADLGAEDRLRLEAAQREAEEARAGLEALRAQAEELRAHSAELRAEAGRLQAQLHALQEGGGHARHDLEDLRREHADIRSWLEDARRERDEARGQVREAIAQVEETKARLEQEAKAAPRDGAKVAPADSGIKRLAAKASGDVASMRAEADAVRARLETLAAEAKDAARRAEEARAEAAAARQEGAETRDETREAQRQAREAADKIDQMDRGAANVLAEVRAQKALSEELGHTARAAMKAAGEARADEARIEEVIASTREQVASVLDDVAAAREQAAAASAAAAAAASRSDEELRAAVERLRDEVSGRAQSEEVVSLRDAIEELGRRDLVTEEQLRSALEEITSGREASDDLRARLAEMADRTAALEARPLDSGGIDEGVVRSVTARIEGLGEEVSAATGRLGELATDVAAAREEAAAGRTTAEERLAEMAAELMVARTEAEQARRTADDLREELHNLRDYAAAAKTEATSALEIASAARAAGTTGDGRIEELRTEVAVVLATVQDFKAGFDEARQAAVAARRDAEAAKLSAENSTTVNDATTEKFTEVWRQLLNMTPGPAVGGVGSPRTDSGTLLPPRRGTPIVATKKQAPSEREPRPGFDDETAPMALLGLDGKFTQLNPPFTKLVGYKEHEFGKAVWPSVHDRHTYKEQTEQLERLAAGELESVRINSTYMHGQGLMVPIVGELNVVRGDDGRPAHLLLVAEERQTA